MLYGYSTLRRRCRSKLTDITLPTPFSVEEFCRNISEQRQRPLHLHALPTHVAKMAACGLWLATDTDDHIFFEARTAPLHQEHIVLHEIGHLLFDHQMLADGNSGGISTVLADLSPRLIQRMLARTNYSTRQEQEAEMLASLIRTHATGPGRGPQRCATTDRADRALGITHD
ncbi:hypothetical protein OEIGOIKO_00485 [Streptomyces chrestomyceticus JCM 4735]|uniref:Regulator component n=1 Tax=Streptomyces chrestomyceticus JCM 4735 TaxID=1306181 RepID=A0A7U9PV39_9ACTN|nr:hypothetical protein OEIGOIKO_00485 [Streptomyces chrestomyceticus JCM 4735]